MMKEKNAVIGGEGNGGIIYPELHYGRDSLVGIALFLSHLANQTKSVSELRASYPNYFMSKRQRLQIICSSVEVSFSQASYVIVCKYGCKIQDFLDPVKVLLSTVSVDRETVSDLRENQGRQSVLITPSGRQ